MEAAEHADEVVAARGEDCHLEAAFDRLRARVGEERELQVAGGDQGNEMGEVGAERVDQLLRMDALTAKLVEHGLEDLRVAVAGHVDPEAAEHIDEFLAVDVLEAGALVLPLDRGVVGADGLAVLEKALVDVVGPVLDALLDDALLLVGGQRLLGDEVEDVLGLLACGLQVLRHGDLPWNPVSLPRGTGKRGGKSSRRDQLRAAMMPR